jgi:hypothetical protein
VSGPKAQSVVTAAPCSGPKCNCCYCLATAQMQLACESGVWSIRHEVKNHACSVARDSSSVCCGGECCGLGLSAVDATAEANMCFTAGSARTRKTIALLRVSLSAGGCAQRQTGDGRNAAVPCHNSSGGC